MPVPGIFDIEKNTAVFCARNRHEWTSAEIFHASATSMINWYRNLVSNLWLQFLEPVFGMYVISVRYTRPIVLLCFTCPSVVL